MINDLEGKVPSNNIYLYSAGTGNDFLKDVNVNNDKLFLVNKYLENLPKVTVKGKSYFFINGVGFGIDGYCCEVGDSLKEKSKKVNYTGIAIKGLLFHFKTVKASIEIDGKETTHEHVWLAPTMKGRFYGGGMMISPNQNRLNEDRLLSNVVFKCKSKLKTLLVFPSIFKGEHIKHSDMVEIISGKKIKVTFDHPTALQIDGETIIDVTSYEAEI